MFWYIMTCVSIAALMFSYQVEIATGKDNKPARYLALTALGLSVGFLYSTVVAV